MRPARSLWTPALIGVVTMAAFFFADRGIPLAAEPAPPNQYVDLKICGNCHRDIAANYARTGMGRSFFKPAGGQYNRGLHEDSRMITMPSPTATTRWPSGTAQYFQRRWQTGSGVKRSMSKKLKIDYVIGSGNHARFYLHRTESGMLIELPLGWYAQKGGEWGMVPGSDLPQPKTRGVHPL